MIKYVYTKKRKTSENRPEGNHKKKFSFSSLAFFSTDMKNPCVQNKTEKWKIYLILHLHANFISFYIIFSYKFIFHFYTQWKKFLFSPFFFVLHSFAISSPTAEKKKKVNLKKLSDRNFSIKTILFFLLCLAFLLLVKSCKSCKIRTNNKTDETKL